MHRKENDGIPVEEMKHYVIPKIWDSTSMHKDYSHIESITFRFGFDDNGEPTREVIFQYLRGTLGTRFKESHLTIEYEALLKKFLKSKSIQQLETISETDLFNFYCNFGENRHRNPLSTRIISMEVDFTGKNTIKIEIGVPKGKTNKILEVINVKSF